MLAYWTEDGEELSDADLKNWYSEDAKTGLTDESFDGWLTDKLQSLEILDYDPA